MQVQVEVSKGVVTRTGAPYPTKFRLRHARTKSGCLVCRRRKKKCDETRPHCSSCLKSKVPCEWPETTSAGVQDQRQAHIQANTSRTAQYGLSNRQNANPLTLVSPSFKYGHPAYDLTCDSSRLLQHYVTETAAVLATGTPIVNPFLTCVVPKACWDPTLMHIVLALSGAHLSYKLPSGDDATRVEASMRKHYLQAIRSVQNTIAVADFKNTETIPPLLLTLAFLCHYEVLAGSPTSALSLHLAALSQLFHRLSESHRAKPPSVNDPTDETVALSLEVLLYLAFSNVILPAPAFNSPDAVPEQVANSCCLLSQTLSSNGAIFAGCRGLFELIPVAKSLHTWRLAEEHAGVGTPGTEFEAALDDLCGRISDWTLESDQTWQPPNETLSVNQDRLLDHEHQAMAAECLRHGLHIYTLVAPLGSSPPSPGVRLSVEGHVAAIVELSKRLEGLPASSNTLWAIVVAGSCLEDEEWRRELAAGLVNSRFQMRHLSLIKVALEKLWEDEDPQAWGPHGLDLVMRKHGLSISIL